MNGVKSADKTLVVIHAAHRKRSGFSAQDLSLLCNFSPSPVLAGSSPSELVGADLYKYLPVALGTEAIL